MSSYDEALFVQGLKRRARNGVVTRQDVADAFWSSAVDITIAPERRDAAEKDVMENYVPGLMKHYLPRLGLRSK